MRRDRWRKKLHRVKKRRSLFKNRRFVIFVLIGSFLTISIYLLIFHPTFQIRNVKIDGARIVDSATLEHFVKESTRNIFLLDKRWLQSLILDSFPTISRIYIKRNFPDGLEIFVEEREAVAIYKKLLIDKEGVAFMIATSTNNNLFLIDGNMEFIKKVMPEVLEAKSWLVENLGLGTKSVYIVSDKRFNLKNSAGWDIYFNPEENIGWQLQKLDLVLEKEIPPEKQKDLEYIDLRFDNNVYYKYR